MGHSFCVTLLTSIDFFLVTTLLILKEIIVKFKSVLISVLFFFPKLDNLCLSNKDRYIYLEKLIFIATRINITN